MTSFELKTNIKKIVDKISNERLLQTLYTFLKANEKTSDTAIWSKLSNEQKKEILLAFEESEDENNLIEAKKVFKNMR
jgi:hypothetical protein